MKLVNEIQKLLNEGTWDLPFDVAQAKKVAKAMSKPLPAKKAPAALEDALGDDDLFDFFLEKSDGKLSTDVRGGIYDFIQKLLRDFKANPKGFKKPFEKEALKILKGIKDPSPS